MGMIYITSDTHFSQSHDKDFLYAPRGFETIEEMNETVIENYNSIISEDDIVYILGDCILSDTEKGLECLKRLKGKKYLALGNHDTDKRIERYKEEKIFEDIQIAYRIKSGKYLFYLSHLPMLAGATYNQADKTYSICGHSHTQDKFADWALKCYHAELDAHNCYPVSLERIKDEIKQKRKEENNE